MATCAQQSAEKDLQHPRSCRVYCGEEGVTLDMAVPLNLSQSRGEVIR